MPEEWGNGSLGPGDHQEFDARRHVLLLAFRKLRPPMAELSYIDIPIMNFNISLIL
jgi:hypothetical protein